MIALAKLLRRTAVTLSAIAALTVTGFATAQTVVLSGTTTNTCTYSSMTPSGATLTFTCSNSNTATFAITGPAQLPQNALSTADVKLTRTGGLTGSINVDLTFAGCVTTVGSPPAPASTTTITSAANGSTFIPVGTPAASATPCTITITPASGAVSGTNPLSMAIVDPAADVVFAFATTDTAASVGNGSVGITVTRTGGTDGTFTVPVTIVPFASGGGLLSSPTGGTLSTSTLTFNSPNPVAFTYTAPAAGPSGVTLPATMVLALGTPTKTSAASAQVATSSTGTNTITLSPKSTSCNATVNPLALSDVPTVQQASGVIYTYELPRTNQRKISGTFKLSSTVYSNPVAPWNYEVHISKCAGQIDAAVGGTCYISSSNSAQLSLNWFENTAALSPYNSIAGIQSMKACWAPATEGPWYINFRYNYADCNALISGHPLCGWKATAQNYAY
jgi:hypothetical protein